MIILGSFLRLVQTPNWIDFSTNHIHGNYWYIGFCFQQHPHQLPALFQIQTGRRDLSGVCCSRRGRIRRIKSVDVDPIFIACKESYMYIRFLLNKAINIFTYMHIMSTLRHWIQILQHKHFWNSFYWRIDFLCTRVFQWIHCIFCMTCNMSVKSRPNTVVFLIWNFPRAIATA